MNGSVVINSNLATLLIVGNASERLIERHKRLSDYNIYHFQLLGELLTQFSDIITLPHVLSETSSLVQQISKPAYSIVQDAFRTFVDGAVELSVPSRDGCMRAEFHETGLTDAMLLQLCSLDVAGRRPTLLTSDSTLADCALSMGYSVIDYRREYMTD